MVLKEAALTNNTVHTIEPILHNPQMVNILKEKRVPVNDVFHVKNGTVVFRTHGIKKNEEEYIRKTGLRIIDTTCPFIKRVRQHAM